MAAINTILFDFGGVLFTPLDAQAVGARREQLALRLGFAGATAMWERFYSGEEWQASKIGHMTDAEMWAALLTPHGLTMEAEHLAFVSELFEYVGVKPEMRRLVVELQQHYTLGILSNHNDRLETLLRDDLALDAYFKAVVNSYRIGVAKPDERAFSIALGRLNVGPEEVFFIDDKFRNTLVAERLGILSHQFDSVETLRADLARRLQARPSRHRR